MVINILLTRLQFHCGLFSIFSRVLTCIGLGKGIENVSDVQVITSAKGKWTLLFEGSFL